MKVSIPKKLIPVLFLLGLFVEMQADTRLVFNFTHLPAAELTTIKNQLKTDPSLAMVQFAASPGELATEQIEQTFKKFLTPKLSGFPLLYAGYITITDSTGLATFPLRHTQKKIYIAVTPDIKMIHVKGSSFSHAEYAKAKSTPLHLFKCEKLEDEKNQPFWRISKIDKPDNNRINPITVVILTNPDNIFVPTGDFMTPASEQLIFPLIKVIGEQDKDLITFRLLDIKHYFESVQNQEKRANDTTIQKITTTF